MVRVAILLAVASVAVAIAVFFVPIGFTEETSWRASVGSTLTTAIALMLTAVALLVTARVESSDYKAEQRTKTDIAELLATLAMILTKGALARSGQIANVDFLEETTRIKNFANSTTGFAMYNLVARKSLAAGGKGEEWRLFFIYVAEMVAKAADPGLVIHNAVQLQELLFKLTERDLHHIGRSVSNLIAGIGSFDAALDEIVVIKAMRSIVNEQRADAESEQRVAMRKLRFLKAKGVDDPNIDLILGVDESDPPKVRTAIARGADQNVNAVDLLPKYEAALADFKD